MTIHVDVELCKSCKLCIHNCPKDVYEISSHVNRKGYNYVAAVRPENCIGCKICERTCPDLALYIEQ